jgi:osmotically inducible protein OsmC
MTEQTAHVNWHGQGKDGHGTISTATGALKDYPYGFASRFEDDRTGTNPEEILGAAHAACFTMAFSFACANAGFATTDAHTVASVRLSKDGEGFVIDHIALTLKATIAGIDEARFQEIALDAKHNCPVSKALSGVAEITLQATLTQPHANFETPAQIVADPDLSSQEKVELLEELEQDARQLATASSEGMHGGEPTNLHEVLDAKEALGLPDAYKLVLSDLRARARHGAPDAEIKSAIAALDALAHADAGAA